MKLTFFNVGYGEAVLLECPDDRAPDGVFRLLIDGGSGEAGEYAGSDTGRTPLADSLRRRGIHRLDLLVSTHIHEDHICGLPEAVRQAPPAALWQTFPPEFYREMKPLDASAASDSSMSKFIRSLNDYRVLCADLCARGCAIRAVHGSEEMIPLCAGLTARVLAPSLSRAQELTEQLRELYALPDRETLQKRLRAADGCMNNFSVVLLLEYRGTRILLPGDTNCLGYAGLEGEVHADLFKLGHHGQKDSITEDLLRDIAPRHAVCCASSDRRYSSAHPDPLYLLVRNGVKCWFSDCPPVPGGDAAPPHTALEFTIGPNGTVEGIYR